MHLTHIIYFIRILTLDYAVYSPGSSLGVSWSQNVSWHSHSMTNSGTSVSSSSDVAPISSKFGWWQKENHLATIALWMMEPLLQCFAIATPLSLHASRNLRMYSRKHAKLGTDSIAAWYPCSACASPWWVTRILTLWNTSLMLTSGRGISLLNSSL